MIEAIFEIPKYGFTAQKIRLVPETVDLFGNGYVELRARERKELPEKDILEHMVRRDPVVQEIIKTFSARIVEIRPR